MHTICVFITLNLTCNFKTDTNFIRKNKVTDKLHQYREY